MYVCTCTERWFPCPAPVGPARPVLWSSGQVEAGLTCIDQRVAKGWQFNGSHIRLGWQLGLAAVVGWGGRRREGLKRAKKKKRKRGRNGLKLGWTARGIRGATDKQRKVEMRARVKVWGSRKNICICSRVSFPLCDTYVFVIWAADCALTNALRLKTAPGEIGQTSARNGALK